MLQLIANAVVILGDILSMATGLFVAGPIAGLHNASAFSMLLRLGCFIIVAKEDSILLTPGPDAEAQFSARC